MDNIIKFDCNYPKLCNQAKARLIYYGMITLDQNFKNTFPSLIEYNTKKPDGTYKEIPNGDYYLLFFVGDKGIMFSIIRKMNDDNLRKYFNNFGKWFNIEVNNDR